MPISFIVVESGLRSTSKSKLCPQSEEIPRALATFQKHWDNTLCVCMRVCVCEIKDRGLFKNLLISMREFQLDLQGARVHVFLCVFFYSGSFSTSKDVTVYLKVRAQLLLLRECCQPMQEALSPL